MLFRRIASISARTAPQTFSKTSVRGLALAVRYHQTGDAEKVYKIEQLDASFVNAPLQQGEVALKFLAAPINPSDINLANGTYGIQPKLPAIGGNEGVAVVEKVGGGVKNLKVGDWVLPANSPFGTWTQYTKAQESALMKIDNDIPAEYAATLAINPATAYRLLKDFVNLKPGDVIVQNGANSMVGMAVIQLAREMGVKTINVVRSDRPDADSALRLLSNLGGDINIVDNYLNTREFKEILAELPPIRLGLNCVGGESTTNLVRGLSNGATLVTYGGMSKKHLTIPSDLLTYKNLQLKGFWIADWYATHSAAEREAMYKELVGYIREKKLSFFFESIDLDDFAYALEKSTEPFRFRKVVLNVNYPDRLKEHDSRPESDYMVFDTSTV